jgi:hypothetical protein
MSVLDSIRVYCTTGTGPDIGVLQRCLQGVYNVGVALAVALAFLYIIYGAVEYMVGAATNKQSAGKDKIINALIGMLIIFLSGTVLYWINPQIFSAKLILYKVKTLEVPILSINDADGQVVRINDPEFEQISKQKFAVQNTVLASDIASKLPPEIRKAVELAHLYANNQAGNQEYIQKYGTSNLNSCSHFVYRVLRESGAVPNTCSYRVANNTGDLMEEATSKSTAIRWERIHYNRNNLRPGDVLVNIRAGSSGHIAIAVPVKAKNGEDGLVLAHASLSRDPSKSKPPRITNVYDDFDYIYRAQPK